ncbi:MAG: sensor histidine kinase [Verrucomicrobiota bacterium]|nr:sensor histidine kinase [Verrucomicrobiota bacterium]
MPIRSFDLNIEEVQENWEVEHAIREVISNALDEQLISQTAEISITKDDQGDWHIRDYGRGLQIEHFTLNENKEKLDAPTGVIGKFGVGLKDALATFSRRGIEILICSRFGTYRLKQEHKYGFDDIVTLHVEYDDSPIDIQGTEFVMRVSDADMEKAKSLFLKFSKEGVLETNDYGQILRRNGSVARVYILGVFASEEPNFLFSYNITSLTESMKKKLNRERLNVGRATYADRIKAILRNAKSKSVEALLIEQVEKRASGEQADEMAWIEISQMALNLMHQQRRVTYFTEEEIQSRPNILDSVKSDGYDVVVITDQQKAKLEAQVLTGGPQVRTVETYVHEYNSSFEYNFVGIGKLSQQERRIYEYTPKILALVGLSLNRIPEIRISETMRITTDDTQGVWDSSIPAIVIKRSKLSSLVGYAATLLHEVGHATTGAVDATREFESVLTGYLGRTSQAAIKS